MSILLADIDATCAALGYSDGERYLAEPDVVEGLKHLIWILRHDLDNHEYLRHMGRAKVLQTDLVCMLPNYINDDNLSDILIRLLVILSNPIMLLYREGPPKDNHGRKVYLELIDILQGYKNAFANDAIWSALCIKLKKCFEVDWALRSEDESLLIERILVLMRNVLQVPMYSETECCTENDASVHDRVIWAMHQSGMLNLLLFIISSPDEHQFHLHGLEILCLLYREQTAESLADASLQRSTSEKQRDEQELISVRRREKQLQQIRPPPARHSRFGGTYVIRNMKSVSDRDIICHQPLERVVAMDFDREKQKQKASFRHIREEAQSTRRSALSVRLCLREFCNEVLTFAYNTLIRQVRKVLERNSGTSGNDDSYLLWAIRFFMEFNRLKGLQLQLVSESLSVQCFHWVLMRMQYNMEMIISDKKQARVRAKRLHVGLQTFRELLQSLLALQKLQDGNAQELFDMLLNNVCYVLEYRETILHLLMNYNESHSTKAYLRDVVETAHIFIKIMEKFCKDTILVQDKMRHRKKNGKKPTSADNKKHIKSKEELEEEYADKWAAMASDVSICLNSELELPEDQQIVPFDAISEKNIDEQSEDCMTKIHKLLHAEKIREAICLLRTGREVWPENDTFGAFTASPDDEFLLLREIYIKAIATVDETIEEPESPTNELEKSDEQVNDEEFGYDDAGIVEKTFKFDDFAKRLLNGKIVRACTVVLTDWLQIPTRSLKAAVTILHRIAYGCACPAMLYQAKLFRIFQEVLNSPRDQHSEELRRLAIYITRKFAQIAPNNPKIYSELLFYKNVREANEVETGYCDDYDAGAKGTWTEQEEEELRFLFEENQRNPETDKDVIDWMLDNLINKTRTRRGVLKKLREMELVFKAPTKKSAAYAVNKNHWQPEQDEELRSLYDQYRLKEDCFQRIVTEFVDRRNKQQIIKRMLQLNMIADKSEILPAKPARNRSKMAKSKRDILDEHDFMNEPSSNNKTKKSRQPVQRNIARTPLDVGTVRALIAQIDIEKYESALKWLNECLEDAVEDTEEPCEDDDGVPLLPLLEIQKEAMEDGEFKKLLIALGMQPPIVGIENYWRIPTYLNAADIKKRAKIVAGEELEIDVESEKEPAVENFTSEAESTESEEDYLEKIQREKMNQLMFTQSDEEYRTCGVPLANKVKKMLKKNVGVAETDDSDDEVVTVKLISKKFKKNRQNPDILSSENEDEVEVQQKQQKTNFVFDQLKTNCNKSKENKPLNKNTTSNEARKNEDEDVIAIEKKLKRKLRQPDAISSDEQEQLDDLFERLRKQTENSISEFGRTKKNVVPNDFASDVEKKKALLEMQENDFDEENGQQEDIIKLTNTKAYAASLIDPDGASDTKNDTDDTTSNQSVNNKRQRSPSSSVNATSDSDLSNENNDVIVNDEITSNIKRSYGKRRRLNIIYDDEDQDD